MSVSVTSFWKRPWARAALTVSVAAVAYCARRGLTLVGLGAPAEDSPPTWSYDRAGGWG